MGFGGGRAIQGWEPSPGTSSSCQLTALAGGSTHLRSVGCSPHLGSPVSEFLGVLPEGLAQLLVGGLEVAGQRLGRVPERGQAQLPLQPLLGTALGRAGMRREGRVCSAGLDRQRRGLQEGEEVMAIPSHPSSGLGSIAHFWSVSPHHRSRRAQPRRRSTSRPGRPFPGRGGRSPQRCHWNISGCWR